MIALVEYVGGLDDVEKISQAAVNGEADLRQKPIDIPVASKRPSASPIVPKPVAVEPYSEEEVQADAPAYVNNTEAEEPKSNIGDRLRGFFGSMFE